MDLSDFFITQSQATDFAAKLATIIDSMYTNNFSLEKALSEQFGLQKKDAFLKLFRENGINDAKVTQVQDFLKKIQQTIATLPLVELTIAFNPTEEVMKAISQWFIATQNKQVLLEIHVNPLLLAGATITCNGKFKDYSFTKKFEEVVNQIHAVRQNAIAPVN